jgi:AraC family transcriptional regulator, regulatory protein of adaptative response / methylated-DNA-[protein]-cysteine methyltransferase
MLNQLFQTWSGSGFAENPTAVCPIVKDIFRIDHQKRAHPFNLQIKGTNFQINVWKALLNIPKGCVVSYQDIASYIGHPRIQSEERSSAYQRELCSHSGNTDGK